MKSVAIIGAGPSGLVAAKTLLHSCPPGTFQVSIFEQSSRVGGLWAVEPPSEDGLMNPQMRTNLTNFTISFSDFSWDSVDLEAQPNDSHLRGSESDGSFVPIYPKAWQVGRYLQKYYQKYVPADIVSFNTKVTQAKRLERDGRGCWQITYINLQSIPSVEVDSTFDHVIVASGFLSRPRNFDCELGEVNQTAQKIIHSSQFRTLSNLSSDGTSLDIGKVLVVGGSHSGGDIAASIAFQFSNRQFSPSTKGGKPLEVIHVMPRPMYALPPIVPAGDETPAFIPLDLFLYKTASRPDGPISFTLGKMTPQRAEGMRSVVESLLDGKRSTPSSTPAADETKKLVPPYVIVGESYEDFVRSGAITPKTGRLVRLTTQQTKTSNSTKPGLIRATIANSLETIQIEDIAAVVYATGYTASSALSFLSEDVKSLLDFDESCPRLPLLLNDNYLSGASAIPDIALIGFTEAPYWGIMEMQARATAQRWASNLESGPEVIPNANSEEVMTYLRESRYSVTYEKSTVGQGLFGDYPGLMEQACRELRLQRNDFSWGEREGAICPGRYVNAKDDQTEAGKTMAKLQLVTEKALHQGAFVARAAFRALHGKWKAQHQDGQTSDRSVANNTTITDASFHPRFPTDPAYDFEYLYIEKPTTFSDSGRAEESESRRRVYRYREASDQMSVWSVRGDDRLTVTGLDYVLDFDLAAHAEPPARIWTAKGVCEDDSSRTIFAKHTFCFGGAALDRFSIARSTETQGVDSLVQFTRWE